MNNLVIDKNFGSIMIIVPHQDDEILMSAGVIRSAIENGLDINIVMATNGDYECSDFSKGYGRIKETIDGCSLLGVKKENIIFMGYADTGMYLDVSFLHNLYNDTDALKIHSSACSNKTYSIKDMPEYRFKKDGVHSDYNKKCFEADLKDIISEFKPQNIFTTSPIDIHGDHSGLYKFVSDAVNEIKKENNYSPNIYVGLIHSSEGDDFWPLRDTFLFTEPKGCEFDWNKRYVLSMPKNLIVECGENNLKRQALLKYEIALEPDAVEFLMSFIKNEEVFWKIES